MSVRGLRGKTAIITGAAGGIGSAAVRRLLEEGCRVVAVDQNEAALEKLYSPTNRDHLLTVAADVSTEEGCDQYVAIATRLFGGVDLFFNNAGIMGRRELMVDMAAQDFDRVIAVNLRGVFLGLRAVLRQMIKQARGGAIVNTSSAGALKTYARSSAYGTSKAGVISLTKVAALENGVHRIRVNAVCPGSTDTPLLAPAPGAGPVDWSAMAAKLPIPRMAEPSEIVDLVAYLLSDEATYQTGGAYTVDGGLLLG